MIGDTTGKHPRLWTAEDWVDDTRSNGSTNCIEILSDDVVRVYSPIGNWALCSVVVAPPQIDSEVTVLRYGDMQGKGMSSSLISGEIVE